MLAPLRQPTFRTLFVAQVVALLGTGLSTVALGLLAWELSGADAGLVLGTALAIKMIAYVGIAPIAGAYADRIPRRLFLICLDILRAAIALLLPFVDQIWQIYVLIFLLQSSSAAFTPTFQATIPDILPDEDEYTKALSLSRLAYDLENLISPALAAALLTVIGFHWLFAGTALGFVCSALLIMSVILPRVKAQKRNAGIYDKTTRGIRFYLATPRLRGLMGLNLAVSAAGAMVIVNTVVYVRSMLGGSETDVAIALATFGAGSMIAALALPELLKAQPERTIMICGGTGLIAGLLTLGSLSLFLQPAWSIFLVVWFFLGLSNSTVLTPSGRLLRRSAHPGDRPEIFAAQFALSHACWLITYPLAGWLGVQFGMTTTMLVLAGIAAIGLTITLSFWPSTDPELIEHTHDDLPADHKHWSEGANIAPGHHKHAYIIDDLHTTWPKP